MDTIMNSMMETEEKRDYYEANMDFGHGRRLVGEDELVDCRIGNLCRIWRNEQNEVYLPHRHSALEIIMPEKNVYTVKAFGKNYELREQEIFFMPPGMLHELVPPSDGARFIYLMDVSRFTSLRSFSSIMTMLSHPLHITPDEMPVLHGQLREILLQMNDEYFSSAEYSDLSIPSQLLKMLVLIGRSSELSLMDDESINVGHKEYFELFNNSLRYVDEHFAEKISLEDMSARTGFSKFHFSRLFKKYTGCNFSDYLCARRINEARMLLMVRETSVTDVAISSGFSSISTFNRVFKQKTGFSPSEYRQMNLAK